MFNDGGSPELIDCTFDGNIAGSTGAGGGIANLNSSAPRIEGCLFVHNEAYAGAAIHNTNSSSPAVMSCTITGNRAGSQGGGLYNAFNSHPTVTSAILWGDSPDEIVHDAAKVTFSDVQGGYAGSGNINKDPLFVNADDDNYRLTAGSRCVDAGDSGYEAPPGSKDRDGNLRVWDGNGDGQAVVDMGVYEFGSFAFGDLNCDGGIDFNDIDAFVAAMIGEAEYEQAYPECDFALADVNADGVVDFEDIDSFVECLINGGCN